MIIEALSWIATWMFLIVVISSLGAKFKAYKEENKDE